VNVHVGEVSSTVRATDSQALLSPEVMDRLTAILLGRVREELDRDRKLEAERHLRPGLEGILDLPWERQ
jgi:hypothetical protein